MKKLIAISVLLLFVFVPVGINFNAHAQDPPSLSEFVNCVGFFSRVLRVRENRCRSFEFEVKVDGDAGNGGGNGIAAVQGDVVEQTCPGGSLLAIVACPEGKLIVGATCLVDVTSGDPDYVSYFNFIWGDRNIEGPSQATQCNFTCGFGSPSGQYNGTAVAFCMDDPFAE